MEQRRRRPSPDELAWVERSMGRGARVVGWRRLTGGITSSVHRLAVDTGGERPVQVVLRRWIAENDGQREWAARAVEHEARVLSGVTQAGVPAPAPIATTDGAATGGNPATLMSRAPGSVFLTPSDPDAWLAQMAAALPAIHAAPVEAPPWERWTNPDGLEPPSWSRRPDIWKAAIAAADDVAANPPAQCFIHRDFQHFNMLWARERLTAVIDWPNASHGPPDVDVGHCRLNLAVLFSADWAERFRRAYEAEAGRTVDPRQDASALLSYSEHWKRFIPVQVDGRARVDLAGMNRRVEDALAAIVARL